MTDLDDGLPDLVPDSIVARAMDGRVRHWNGGAERLYGWPAHAVLGRDIDELVRSRHPFGLAAIMEALKTDGRWEGEIFRTAADGRELCVSVRAMLRRGADGSPPEIIEWSRDTARASKSEIDGHRYENIFHAMAVSFWELDFSRVRKAIGELVASGVTDVAGYLRTDTDFIDAAIELVSVVDVNDMTAELFAAPRDIILSQHMGWAWPPDSRHVFAESLIAAARQEDSYSTETVVTTYDGRRMDVLFTVCWPTGHKAKGTVLVGVIDISERKRATAELRRSEERYRRLFEAMAVGYLEADMDRVDDLLDDLRAAGVEDLVAYIDAHPEFVRRAIDAIVLVDANEMAIDLFEAGSRDNVLGAPGRFIPPEGEWAFREAFVSRYHKRKLGPLDLQFRTSEGKLIDVRFTTWTTPDRPRGENVLISLLDIGEHKRAYRELEVSEHRYRDLFNHMPIALLQLDMRPLFSRLAALRADGIADLAAHVRDNPDFVQEALHLPRIEDANAEALRLFEAGNVDDIRGPITWGWKESPETIGRSLQARLAGRPSYSEETRVNTLAGNVTDVLYAMSFPAALMDRGINVVGFVDISERKRADRALGQSERRYRDLFNHMPIALWQCDTSGLTDMLAQLKAAGVTDLGSHFDAHPGFLARCLDVVTVQEVNDATVRLCGGTDPAEFAGTTAARYWHRNPGPFRRSMEARWAGKSGHGEETRMLALDGREIDVAFSISYPPALQERGITVFATVDIHDRKRAEERLRRAQADVSHAARVSTLGELTASIAHEVNQPLAAISALGQASLRWLARAEPDLQEVAALAGQMVADARRASDIIARIRGMALKRDPELAPLLINEVVEEALLIVRHESQSKAIDISVRLGSDLPLIHGDKIQLQQVVINLAVNAIQAMASNTARPRRLTVSTGLSEDGSVTATVSDTGPGIAATDIDDLFTGFFTTKKEGMGMGLSICRSIVQSHDGTISARNGPDGACFVVRLPPALRQ
ncbi:PAS domain S-box protein [Paroceanicella profunda]|uniref:histidine kinase n=1 Tax=Paroceanicella profunda TaxID=2579971 RepID=A0A5B8FUW3_9RHOB|nr:PAS domain S-box protein [Paroceanicella profunda]QDL91094.1 PAS domain S-box protein [Paroceanicella profunda]